MCAPGYIYNVHNAIDKVINSGVTIKEFSIEILKILFNCYIQYNISLNSNISDKYLKLTEELLRKLYYDYYSVIQEYISKELYNNLFNESCANKEKEIKQENFKISLEDFIKLMFSKQPNNNIQYVD